MDAMRRVLVLAVLGLAVLHNGARGTRKFRTDFLQDLPTPGTGPFFDTSVPTNLTGIVGKTAYLNCRVKNLGNRTPATKILSNNHPADLDFSSFMHFEVDESLDEVSWVRHRDIHLLTVGRYTYTSDQRFEAMHSPHTEDWSLRIRYPQLKDSGLYECQISTTPPMGHPLYLTIVEPETEILGGPELFINKGSTINLTCVVKHSPDPPPTMAWSHNSEEINFDSPRGGISLVTEKGPETSSRLLIQRASATDSGEYTCDPTGAAAATVRVHILNGEHPAAMHHGHAAPSSRPGLLLCLALLWVR